MASKASVADQHMQVQENIHSQIKTFCTFMDEVLLPTKKTVNDDSFEFSQQTNISPQHSELISANGCAAVPKQRSISQAELSQKLKDGFGFKLDVKPSQISHKEAGQGLFLDGVVDVGAVLALYPGVIYSPAYHHYIPGYLDDQNPYLITRHDGTVIVAQPWGRGGDEKELWNGRKMVDNKTDMVVVEEGSQVDNSDDALERRNPLALAHFANHPPKGMLPNVMICPYDFPLIENNMRAYIPNILYGNAEVNMKKFGSFWFKSRVPRNSESHVPTLKTVVLVATRALQDEELLLNYRLSNTKRWPEWYALVDEEDIIEK
ncbi:uncharacterized protein [Cicer arietinum]|uniref:Uncharacterized protein LOC101490202 n=1 Tax=Cicer arietinum TaxID=3827 RepID=A0A1S2YNF7_CICAR|nr:uncharacterized protein LOC101490202 [Cicer arietinum]XP_004507403.1 uncharacterized protein LOC101490202 [Cicer arietinum]XP_027191652.1 uncharacterized protein LOC101490202 [Cicer arietinum]